MTTLKIISHLALLSATDVPVCSVIPEFCWQSTICRPGIKLPNKVLQSISKGICSQSFKSLELKDEFRNLI